MLLAIVCNDGSRATANLFDVGLKEAEFGPVISTVVSIGLLSAHKDILEIRLPELPTAEPDATPLVAFLEGRLDVEAAVRSSPDALRTCYELASERLGAPGLVAAVERHVVALLDEGRPAPPALRGLPRIEGLACNIRADTVGLMGPEGPEGYGASPLGQTPFRGQAP